MIRGVLLLSLLVPAAALAQAVPGTVDGAWHGTLGPEGSGLRLVLTLSRAPDGSQRGVLDSVDQNAKLPIDSISTSNDKLRFEIAAIGGVYEGILDREGKHLRGRWSQRGVPAQTLDFDRGDGAGAWRTRPRSGASAAAKAGPFGPALEVAVPKGPMVAVAHGQRILVYELQLANLAGADQALQAVEVLDEGGKKIWRSEALDLAPRVHRIGRPDDTGAGQLVLQPGTRATVFLWVPLTGPAPRKLSHRLEVREPDGVTRPLACAPADVSQAVVRVGPPLRGGGWMAANGPDPGSGHRRTQIPLDGHLYLAQRFAIDWVRVDAEGHTFTGDARRNESYAAFGQEAIAVAPGTVVEVKDGIPENVPGDRAVPIDLTTVAGNHVLLDLGGGRRALYAHLQPGSLKVNKGDKVKRGQVLGLVGNTGNSTEPHLHFHIAEGATPLAAEGVPYQLDFTARKDPKSAAERRKGEIPLLNEVVDFSAK